MQRNESTTPPIRNRELAIKPGLFAKASLRPPSRSTLVIPRQAVLGPPGSRHVFVERDNRAWRLPVEVEDLDAGRFEVLSGVELGAQVLIGARLDELVEGDPVRIRRAPGAAL